VHNPNLAGDVARHLPRDHPARSAAAGIDVPRMPGDAIDDLGNAPVVDQLRRALPNLFEPESTLTPR
jgi:hypothetical protein